MKWHLIVGLLVVSALLHEAFAGRQTFKFGNNKSRSRSPSPTNNPANRRPTSNAVVPYNPQNSLNRFRPSTTEPTPFRPLPIINPSYLPRHRSPLPPPRGDRFERLGNRRPTPAPGNSKNKKSKIGTLKRYEPETGTFRPLIRLNPAISAGHSPRPSSPTASRHSKLLPSLQQLSHQLPSTSSHPIPSTSSHPIPSTSGHPQPSTSSHPIPSTSSHPQSTSSHPQPSTSSNHGLGASNHGSGASNPPNFQPTVPASLTQVSLDPAEQKRLAREQAKAAKNTVKIGRIAKNKAKQNMAAQVTNLEGMKYPNRAAVKCSNPDAPPQSCFDFYVLSVSWGPVARVVRLGASDHLPEKIRSEWTLHGLWPSLHNFNRVPENCNLNLPWKSENVTSIRTSLKKKWFTTYTKYRLDGEFWQHEWDKHGRCAARSQFINKDILAYFKLGLRLFDEALVQEKLRRAGITEGTVLSIKEMRNAISDALGTRINLLFIDHQQSTDETSPTYLAEIMICYTMDFKAMDCPSHPKYYNNVIKDKTIILVPNLVSTNTILWEHPNES